MKPSLLYVLHSGQLYGTERMALLTARALTPDCQAVHLFAPPGPLHAYAQQQGYDCQVFQHPRQLAWQLQQALRAAASVAFFATGVSQSWLFYALNQVWRRPCVHLHLVHGGTDERLSYGRKRYLNALPIRQIAVSEFVRQRLLAHHVRASRIDVVENCLAEQQRRTTTQRPAFTSDQPLRRLAVVARLDPIKRVELVLEALEQDQALAQRWEVDIYGSGWLLETLRARAARLPAVRVHGFCPDSAQRLSQADVLVHTCAQEPFGLAILEAMAARIPVLVPDQGGAANLVQPEVSGWQYQAGNVQDLQRALRQLLQLPATTLNSVVEQAYQQLLTRFSEHRCSAHYRALLSPLLQESSHG